MAKRGLFGETSERNTPACQIGFRKNGPKNFGSIILSKLRFKSLSKLRFKSLSKLRFKSSKNLSSKNLKYLQSFRGKLQTFWYAIFVSIYIWYMFWICYDLFVWSKTVFEVSIISYIGSVSAIICLWIGTLLWKKKDSKKEKYQADYLHNKKEDSANIREINLQSQPIPQSQPIQKERGDSKCGHYLGYLKTHKADQIPDECLTCKDLIHCS